MHKGSGSTFGVNGGRRKGLWGKGLEDVSRENFRSTFGGWGCINQGGDVGFMAKVLLPAPVTGTYGSTGAGKD